jgi:RNA polymerase sigma-70 factor (ECF subfamily)
MSTHVSPFPQKGAKAEEQQRLELGRLFDEHFDAVFGFCMVRCGSRQLAEEVASDTFGDAARHVATSANAHINRSWLFTVAKRRLIDHWRAAQRRKNRIDKVASQPRSPDPTPETLQDERVIDAMNSLPERQRAALALRYLDEMGVAEVAETLDITYRAAESLLSRARRGFAEAYEENHSP